MNMDYRHIGHRRAALALFALAAMLAAAGCSATRGHQHTLAHGMTSFRAPERPGAQAIPPQDPEPEGSLTLEQALRLALTRNPSLIATSHRGRAVQAHARSARLLPNPELSFEAEEIDRTGGGFSEADTSLVLGFTVELGGKRGRRSRLAGTQEHIAELEYESVLLDTFSETSKRFIEVLAAQRRLELMDELVALAEQTSHAVGERIAAGKETPAQAAKAQASLEVARLHAARASDALRGVRTRLSATWGSERSDYRDASGDLDNIIDALPTEEFYRSRIQLNPELDIAASEVRVREAELAIEKANRIPDLEAEIGIQHFAEDGADAAVVGVGVPLPLFDRNQHGVAAAAHALIQARAELRATELKVASELTDVYSELKSARASALVLRSEVVPAMAAAFAAAQKGYEQGKLGFLDMLDAQRGLFESKVQLLDALAAYHGAMIDTQRITAAALARDAGKDGE